MSDAVNRTAIAGLLRAQAPRANQTNSFIWAGSPQMTGIPGLVPDVADVRDYGAVGDGLHDDTEAFALAAAQLITAGGVLLVPPGTYLLRAGTALPSNTVALGAGRGATRLLAINDFPSSSGPEYSFFYNLDWDAPDRSTGNTDITVTGFTFDYSWRTTSNAFASLKMRCVTRLSVKDNYFYYGGNSVAIRKCDNVWVSGNNAYEFRNCAWDFWEGPQNTWVTNNYAETSDTAQMLNYNPEFSPTASSPLNVIGRGLTVIGNTFKATGANNEPCQIEPLANRDNAIEDVVIADNQFYRTYLVLRGDVKRVSITGNTFQDYPDPNTNIIRVHPLNGDTPDAFVIANNVINEPNTESGAFGVIWCDATNSVVTGNTVTGTTYTAEPFYQGTALVNQYGNFFEKPGITGRMRQGFVLTNPNNLTDNPRSAFGWVDLSGNPVRMYMAGNFHQFWSTAADGSARQLWSHLADSDTAQFTWLVPSSFTTHIRVSPNSGLTATGTTYGGALQLEKGYNIVSTVPAASGVRLPLHGAESIVGWEVMVINLGAETLAVYPATNATIADGAVGLHDRILPGRGKTYYAHASTTWTIKSEVQVSEVLDGDDVGALENALADVDLTTAPATEPPTYNLNHVLLYGQSLAIGAEGTPGLSTTAKYGSLMFGTTVGATNNTVPSDVWTPNGGSVVAPLQVNSTQAESVAFGALATYRALTFRSQGVTSNAGQLMLANTCAIGGTAIAALEQGAVPDIFNRLVSCMDQANTYAAGAALTYGVTALVWMQGESDAGTSKATYKTALQGIYTDFCTAALAETGQTANPAMFMYQTVARNTTYNTTDLGVQMAQLEIGLNDAGCFMVGPIYPYNDSDNLHLPANSYRWWGSMLGKVMHRVLTLGQNWQPLHVTSATMRGRRILLEYYVPVGPLAFEDPWLGPAPAGSANAPFAAADKGFTILNSVGAEMTIASVVLAAENQVLITLAADPPVDTYEYRYADGTAGHQGHGCLRDSDPTLADDIYLDMQASQAACERQWDASGKRYLLYNWAVAQFGAITAV